MNDEIEAFKEQSWVKEKYPDLKIPTPQHNSEGEFIANRIAAGKSTNNTDLFFCTNPASFNFHMKDSDGNCYFEDLTDVYESEIPGENITVKEKMKDDIVEMQHIEKLEGGKAYYGLPWIDGMMGLLVNKSIIDRTFGADYILPRTTDELVVMANDLKANNQVVIMSTAKAGYWLQMFVTWWTQYEGMKGYDNFMNCMNEFDERSKDVFTQRGRLRSLEVIESLLGSGLGFTHDEVNTMEYTIAQLRYCTGTGVIMPNGDWFENEMRSVAEEDPETAKNNNIMFMKMPVISTITDKCKTVKDDDTLVKVVQAIDEDKAFEEAKQAVSTLIEADYNKIKEARHTVFHVEGHEAYIPSYATAKETAKDFLRFMASDKGINVFMKATRGSSTPYKYDIQTKDAELYNTFTDLHKERIECYKTCVRIPSCSKYRLFNYGGLRFLNVGGNIDFCFTAKNAKDRKTAKEVYQMDIDFYNDTNFESLLRRAGL